MSSHDASGAPDEEELQFENAEYDTPATAVSCVACKQELSDAYYELNGKVFCTGCRALVDAYRTRGSRTGRFLRALVFGSAAAFGGFLIYFGVMKLADMQIGLISILVGFMVGASVRKGSNHRGGWFYQLLAMFLTYTAIAASYSAAAFLTEPEQEAPAPADAKNPAKAVDAANAQPTGESPPNAGPGAATDPANAEPVGRPLPNPGPNAAAGAQPAKAPEVPRLVYALFILAFTYAIPIVAGFHHPIGLLIVAFALWEAWKLNKYKPVVFAGPFRVSPMPDVDDLPPEGAVSHA